MTLAYVLVKIITKTLALLDFLLFFGRELVISNMRLAFDIVTPRYYTTPGIVKVPLTTRQDIEIVLLANLLTLTPGTLMLEVSDARDMLYVHVMYLDDVEAFRRHVIEQYERRVMKLFE